MPQTLSQTLEALGLTLERGRPPHRTRVLHGQEVVFEGARGAFWRWLDNRPHEPVRAMVEALSAGTGRSWTASLRSGSEVWLLSDGEGLFLEASEAYLHGASWREVYLTARCLGEAAAQRVGSAREPVRVAVEFRTDEGVLSASWHAVVR